MAEENDRLGRIVAVWTEMLRGGSTAALASVLSPDVVWQGVLPDQICHNREEVLHVVGRMRPGSPRLTRFEAEEIGKKLVVSVDGPDFPPVEGQPTTNRRSLVFTFADVQVIRIESTSTRERAFELANAHA